MGKPHERNTVIYARVSTPKQKQDLVNQIELAKNFCIARGWKIDGVYKDISSALNFDERKDFQALLNEIFSYRIKRVIITHRVLHEVLLKQKKTKEGYRACYCVKKFFL